MQRRVWVANTWITGYHILTYPSPLPGHHFLLVSLDGDTGSVKRDSVSHCTRSDQWRHCLCSHLADSDTFERSARIKRCVHARNWFSFDFSGDSTCLQVGMQRFEGRIATSSGRQLNFEFLSTDDNTRHVQLTWTFVLTKVLFILWSHKQMRNYRYTDSSTTNCIISMMLKADRTGCEGRLSCTLVGERNGQ